MDDDDDGSLRPPPGEISALLKRWDRRIRREVNGVSPRDPGDFMDRWETEIVQDGYAIGLARLEVTQRLARLHATYQAPLVAYLNGYLALTDWTYRKSCKMRVGRRGGKTLEMLSELSARGHLISSEIVSLIENGHQSGAQARWRSLFETCAIAEFIYIHGETVARRYHYDAIIRLHHRLLQDASLSGDQESDGDRQRLHLEVTKRYAKIEARFGPWRREPETYWWARPGITETRGKIGLTHLISRDSQLRKYLAAYKAASHELHGDRFSSTVNLVKRADGMGYEPAPVHRGSVPYQLVAVHQHLLQMYMRKLSATVNQPTLDYYEYLCYMCALDVQTEWMRDPHVFYPNFVAQSLGVG